MARSLVNGGGEDLARARLRRNDPGRKEKLFVAKVRRGVSAQGNRLCTKMPSECEGGDGS